MLLNPFMSVKQKTVALLKTLSKQTKENILKNLELVKPLKSTDSIGQLSDEEKAVLIEQVSEKLKEIFKLMKFDIENDPHMKDTPLRIASMWINEYFAGRYNELPDMTLFNDNDKRAEEIITEYDENIPIDGDRIIVAKRINVLSVCSHHFAPYFNLPEQAHNNSYGLIAYVPRDKIIGISKLNRIAQYLGARPTTQEWLTKAIREYLVKILETEDVFVMLKNILHTCEYTRGVKANGLTTTISYSGIFKDAKIRKLVIDL
jgi:GTP cyclohydrolase I